MKTSRQEEMRVVITGASSGNGRAGALEFAKEGARLVLASRNEEALQSVAEECLALGSPQVAIVKTDVSNFRSVEHLVGEAIRELGHIDVFVSNAGVGAFGRLEKTPVFSHEQVIRTNLLGPLYGAYAVIPHFKERKCGILIHTNSVGAFVPLPFSAGYSASKFGLRGFSEALKGELKSFPEIRICDLFPAFVDSPGTAHAANYEGVEIKPPIGSGSAERVGRAMVSLAKKPHSQRFLHPLTPIARMAYSLFPGAVLSLTNSAFRSYLRIAKPSARKDGNLFTPPKELGEVHGHYRYGFLTWGILGSVGLSLAAIYLSAKRKIPQTSNINAT